MNPRTRERVLTAAANCEPADERQAAVIGAIACCLLETGHFQPHTVAAIAADNMGWALSVAADFDATFKKLEPAITSGGGLSDRIFPKRGYPTMPEIREAALVFKAQYDPPEQPVAA